MKPHVIQPFIESGDPTKYIVIELPGCERCAGAKGYGLEGSLCSRLPDCGAGGAGTQFLEYTPENLAFAATQILETP